MICPECGYDDSIKYGRDRSRQIYRSKGCKRKFICDPLGRYTKNIVVDAICYHSLGMSLDSVTRRIRKIYRRKISKSTVHRWIKDSEKPRSRLQKYRITEKGRSEMIK